MPFFLFGKTQNTKEKEKQHIVLKYQRGLQAQLENLFDNAEKTTKLPIKLTKSSSASSENLQNIKENSGWRPRWGRVSTGPRREQKRSHTAEFIRKKYFKCYIFGFFSGRSSINHDF